MSIEVTAVHRNLHTKATFLSLEFEDLFLVLGLAALMNVVSRFVGGDVGGVPMGAILQYGVPLAVVPFLMVFKYGKPKGYLRDLIEWYVRPKAYCCLSHERKILASYIREEEHEREF